jgi:hypothetical protein
MQAASSLAADFFGLFAGCKKGYLFDTGTIYLILSEDDMDDQSKNHKATEIQINTGDEILRGKYSNNMIAAHTADEFILDWLINSPSGVHLVSRIIVTPSHLKRIIDVLKENLDKYEKQFGNLKEPVPADHKFH